MKNLAFTLWLMMASAMISFAQTTEEKKVDPDASEIVFTETTHDFGKVKFAADCEFEFEFKNTGKTDLLLTNVRPSCGCTAVTGWQEIGPVKKGKKAKIKIKYDSKRVGPFNKTITVTSNAKNDPVILTIKGEIEPQERADAPKN